MKDAQDTQRQSFTNNDAQLSYIVSEPYTDRDRLYMQYELFRPDFNRWFDRALKLGDLATDPENAKWRVLDAGCGEGLFSYEISNRYPRAHVLGFDKDEEAVATANRVFGSIHADQGDEDRGRGNDRDSEGYLRFFTHDVLEPLSSQLMLATENTDSLFSSLTDEKASRTTQSRGFHVVFAHLVLMHVRQPDKALTNLADALKPGGVIYLRDSPTDPFPFQHPSLVELLIVAGEAIKRIASHNFAYRHQEALEKVGFTSIETGTDYYIVGGPTEEGQRMLVNIVSGLKAARTGLVEALHLIEGKEFDEHIRRLENETTTDMSCQWAVVNTIARKPS